MWIAGFKSIDVQNEKVVSKCLKRINRDVHKDWSFSVSPLALWGSVARTTTFEQGVFLWWETFAQWFRLMKMFEQTGHALSLARDPKRVFKDFEATTFTGAVASGLASLYMDRIGYAFFAHTEDTSHVRRPNVCRDGGQKTPDWLYCAKDGTTAAVESKGSLSDVWHDATTGFKGQVRPLLGGARALNGVNVAIDRGVSVGSELSRTGTILRTVHSHNPSRTSTPSQNALAPIAKHHFSLVATMMGVPVLEGRISGAALRSSEFVVLREGARDFVFAANTLQAWGLLLGRTLDLSSTPWPFWGLERSTARQVFRALAGEPVSGFSVEVPEIESGYDDFATFRDGSAIASSARLMRGDYVRWDGEDFG